jgi:hypothetical protein
MTIREAIIQFLRLFIDVCNINKNDDYEDCQSINSFVEYIETNIEEDKTFLLPFVKCFVEDKIEHIGLDSNVVDASATIFQAELVDFLTLDDFKRRYRKFSFSNNVGSYIPIEFLNKNEYFNKNSSAIKVENIENNETFAPNNSFIGVLHFIIKNSNENAVLTELVRAIYEKQNHKSIVVSKEEHSTLISAYSYVYYEYLLNGFHTELDIVHKYSKDLAPYGALVTPELNKDFSQFIELADVMNEANMSPDILSRYLKFYHQLEYLTYRIHLKKIALNAEQERSFITDLHKLSGSNKNSEEETFKKSFKELFKDKKDDFKQKFFDIAEPNKQDLIDLFKNKFEVQFVPADNGDDFLAKFSRIIYKIRNTIVHNKESEFHLTITKIDSYPVLKFFIPWLINLIEFEIDSLLRSFHDVIKYENRTIQLY